MQRKPWEFNHNAPELEDKRGDPLRAAVLPCYLPAQPIPTKPPLTHLPHEAAHPKGLFISPPPSRLGKEALLHSQLAWILHPEGAPRLALLWEEIFKERLLRLQPAHIQWGTQNPGARRGQVAKWAKKASLSHQPSPDIPPKATKIAAGNAGGEGEAAGSLSTFPSSQTQMSPPRQPSHHLQPRW